MILDIRMFTSLAESLIGPERLLLTEGGRHEQIKRA